MRRDLTGMSFSRLTVIGEARKHYWLCRCECGVEKSIYQSNLISGRTRSCGCLNRENLNVKGTHRKTGTEAYRVWAAMKARCYRVTSKDYPNWGGRGITVCDRWKNSFENFLEDMGDRPPGFTIDRIDVNGNYEPGNCRWATKEQQSRNKTNNHVITFNGESACISEWAERVGIKYFTICSRLASGWTVEDSLTIPIGTTSKTWKLAPGSLADIIRLREDGNSFRNVGKQLGVSEANIRRILRKRQEDNGRC